MTSRLAMRTAAALSGLLVLVGAVQAQTTLFMDDFSGAGGSLNGASPDVTVSGAVWSANNAFNDNGTINVANEGSALLPFSPVVNATYVLSMDVLNTSANWMALGFAQDPLAAPGASAANDRLVGRNGIAWMLYRNNAAANAIQSFTGLNTAGGVDLSPAGVNFNVANQLKIILDTTGDGSSFTADWRVNDVSLRSETINLSVDQLNFVGLSYDNTAAAAPSFDNFLLTQQITGVVPNEWDVDGGGVFGVAGNWTMGVPASGGSALFGPKLTAPNSPATVTLSAPAALGEVQFNNTAGRYVLAGPSTLTLNGAHTMNVVSGAHEVSAAIAGSAGLVKSGGGDLTLSGANTYTGLTDVQQGILRVRSTASVTGAVAVATGASLVFDGDALGGGYSGTFANDISGAGAVELGAAITSETVTFAAAKTYTGQTLIRNGTLQVTGAGTLGAANGTGAAGTVVDGGDLSAAKLALSGGANLGAEVVTFGARQNAAAANVHLTNVSGSNSIAGNIRGVTGGSQYNIESQAGTLTLGGILSAPDTGIRNFVFSGAGNTTITGKLVDHATDADGNPLDANLDTFPDNALDNVNVVKRGAGTLSIQTATGGAFDYYRGTTVVEQGVLRVQGNGTTLGELLSSSITVRSGASMNIASFSTYNQQTGQTFAGAGIINTGDATLGLFGDGNLSPGDGVGTLTINGNVTLNRSGATGGTLSYELGNTVTPGGSESDLVQINGSLTGSGTDAMTVRVTPADADLAAGSYRLINHTAGAAIDVTGFATQVVNQRGDVLNPRQTLQVTSAAGQVNLQVAGSEAELTWAGTLGNHVWDVATSTNWSGGNQFRDLDDVTFGPAGEKNVTLNSIVAPGVTNFSGGGATTYTVSGAGAITGYGAVNVNSGTVKLYNTGNDYRGTTTVAAGARLEASSAITGSVVVNGTLELDGNVATSLIDNFDSALSGAYTTTRILDANAGASNTFVWQTAGGAAQISTSVYDGIEQSALTRTDTPLAIGQELRIDVTAPAINSQDIGLYVGAGTPTPDVRQDYVAVYRRNNGQVLSRGFNGTTELSLVGGTTPADLEGLFVKRTGTNVFEVGYYDNGVRTLLATRTLTATTVGDAIGLYSDVRSAGIVGDVDNLRVQTGSDASVLSVNGDLTLGAGSVLELSIGGGGFDALNVTGAATLGGSINVSLAGGFAPADGAQYTVLTAGSIAGSSVFNLPTNFSAAVGADSIVLTYAIPAGLPGDFNDDGFVDAADYTRWRDNLGLSDAALSGNGTGDVSGLVVQADYTLWKNSFGAPASAALAAGSGAVPEPAAIVLLAMGAALTVPTLRRKSVSV